MSATKPRRIMVTMPIEMDERTQVHRERGGFRSQNAANVDLVKAGLEWVDGAARRAAMAELLNRLRHWGANIP